MTHFVGLDVSQKMTAICVCHLWGNAPANVLESMKREMSQNVLSLWRGTVQATPYGAPNQWPNIRTRA